ncbi:MAG: hypothetical protein ACK5LY_00800 [Lachnospirales bacterium]
MQKLNEFFQDGKINTNYIFLLAISLIVILVLNSNPFEKDTEQDTMYTNSSYEMELETKLENILSKVSGAGKVEVLITVSNGGEKVIAKSTNSKIQETTENKDNLQKEVFDEEIIDEVIYSDKSSGEPFILYEKNPSIQGVLIVAEGGDNALIRDAFIHATESLLGVSSYKISVLKMDN